MKLVLSKEEIIKAIQNKLDEMDLTKKFTITTVRTKCNLCEGDFSIDELEIFFDPL